MKLVYLANLRLPTEKAYGIQIFKMCGALSDAGSDVTLVFPNRETFSGEDIFEYYGVGNNFSVKKLSAPDFYFPGRLDKLSVMLKNFISAIGLAFYAMTRKFDVIFSRDELPLFFLSFFRKNLVFEAHKFSKKRFMFYNRFKRAGVRVVAITEGLRKEFLKTGFEGKNILVAPDGVNISEFNRDISEEDARRKVGLPVKGGIVMYAGHLFEWKGAHILAEASKLIPHALFVFVGGTDADIMEFKNRYGSLANVLVVGRKLHSDVPVYLKAADVLVLPNSGKDVLSEKFTSPLKLFEYMASKRPIVASDLPSIREVLNEENSVLVRSDDIQSLADGLTKVLNNKDLSDRMVQKAFSDVSEYTWQKRAKNILEFLKSNIHVR